ncbi:DUF234 domain-containing protein [Gordonia sp. i37]|uniref:DUF234 domain-containing protein n=1 Tax=Gordonia sp. i37 TaxID=1961707 RepID=UPI0025B7581A|nr:DUF234 domain-containing protein [Gordonia sp. i37]
MVPVTEKESSTRRRIYRIVDNFLAFYLRVVESYKTEIERGLGESILPVLIDTLDDFMGDRWEDMVLRHVRRMAAAGTIGPEIVRVGRWWNRTSSVEIDLVALSGRAETVTLCGKVKWRSDISDPGLLRTLRDKAAALVDDVDSITYLLAARNRISLTDNILAVTPDDVFGPQP